MTNKQKTILGIASIICLTVGFITSAYYTLKLLWMGVQWVIGL